VEDGAITLRDGSTLRVRPIEPSDKEMLERGVDGLSEDSRYKRFLSAAPGLSDSQLRYLTEVDHHDHEALVATTEEGDLKAVGRWVRLADEADAAEVAVAVSDGWHGRGVATGLLKRLAERAKEEGIERFTATALASNHAVIELLEDLGPAHVSPIGSGLVEMRIELPAESGDDTPLRRALKSAAQGRIEVRGRHTASVGSAQTPGGPT
jgi:GNAT superfamily N-acetyltransferase